MSGECFNADRLKHQKQGALVTRIIGNNGARDLGGSGILSNLLQKMKISAEQIGCGNAEKFTDKGISAGNCSFGIEKQGPLLCSGK